MEMCKENSRLTNMNQFEVTKFQRHKVSMSLWKIKTVIFHLSLSMLIRGGGVCWGFIHVCLLFCTPTTHIASISLEAHNEYANYAP